VDCPWGLSHAKHQREESLGAIPRRKSFLISILLVLIAVIIFQVKTFRGASIPEFIGEDFASYWASGRLLFEGEDPYSAAKLSVLEKSIGWTKESPLVPYNPPWAIAFVLPFCIEKFQMGKMIWLSFHFLLIFFSSILFFRLYLPAKLYSPWAILIVFTFAPIHFMLMKGQIASFVLMGTVLFLWFERKQKFLIAGLAMSIAAAKPHLCLLLWPVLILWAFEKRRWSFLFGMASGLLGCLLVALAFNRSILGQYINLLANVSPATYWVTPSIGTLLRHILGLERTYLQFLPALVGLTWVFVHWRKYRDTWDWPEQTPLLLAASLNSAFYVWANDFILLLPIIIQTLVIFWNQRGEYFWQRAIPAYILFDGILWFLLPSQFWYFWVPPACLTIYILTSKILPLAEKGPRPDKIG
jgi:hypothetical protein